MRFTDRFCTAVVTSLLVASVTPAAAYADPYLSLVRLQVTPRDAEVFVDGYLVGTVDDFDGFAQRLRLDPGEHTIQLYLEGYRLISQALFFQPGETYRLRHAMERLEPGDPQPSRPSPAAPSSSTTPSRSAPYDAFGRPMPDRNRRRGMPRPGALEGAGTLTIRVQPPDAVILIDGERWQSSASGEPLRVHVTSGTHRMEVQKDGYQPFLTTVEVRPGETVPLNVSLTPRPPGDAR